MSENIVDNKSDNNVDCKTDHNSNHAETETAKQNFLRSYDFLKLGQAINCQNWQVAAMTVQCMLKSVQELGLDEFERQLVNIRQCIMHRQGRQAKDILALMSAKRVQLLKQGREN